MKLLYDCLIQFIVKYNKLDTKDKKEIIKDIIVIESICNQYYPKDNYYKQKIIELCNNFYLNLDISCIDLNSLINDDFINSVKKDDISYLYYIIDKLNLDNNIISKNMYSMEKLLSYINYDEEYIKLINYIKNRTIFDSNFVTSCLIEFNEEYMMILSDNSMISYIHELTHLYSLSDNIYAETGSIIMEMGLKSYYKLGDINNRISSLYLLKEKYEYDIKNYIYAYYDSLKYVYGTLISYAVISKYGNDFKTLKDITRTIDLNSDESLLNMLDILNINDNDIISSFKNKEKILCK